MHRHINGIKYEAQAAEPEDTAWGARALANNEGENTCYHGDGY